MIQIQVGKKIQVDKEKYGTVIGMKVQSYSTKPTVWYAYSSHTMPIMLARGVVDSLHELVEYLEGEIPDWAHPSEAFLHGETVKPEGYGCGLVVDEEQHISILVVWRCEI